MNQQIIFLGLLFLAVILEAIADVSFKYSYLQNKPAYLWGGIALYTIGTIIWAMSLRYEFLSKAISLFSVINLIIVILVGIIVFKEDLSLINKVGVGVGILSVILMQI